jgi:plastocyanin
VTPGLRRRVARAGFLGVWLLAWSGPAPAHGQSVLERSPNLHGGWTGLSGTAYFNVVHRFNQGGPPERRIQNRPTFLLAFAAAESVLAGVQYATRSALEAGVPNEWEPFVRAAVLSQGAAPADAAAQLSWNAAMRSFDVELTVARQQGPLRLLAAVRALQRSGATGSDAAGRARGWGEAALVPAVGAAVRLHQHVAISADAARSPVSSGAGSARPAVWGLGVQFSLPATPHSLSLHASNADATTGHAASRAAAETRWGFEFTMPITLARYFGGRPRSAAGDRAGAVPGAVPDAAVGGHVLHSGDTIVVRAHLHNLRFMPDTLRIPAGTVVEWRNDDPLPHTVTAQDGSWDSGEIAPGAVWRFRFATPGSFDVVCTPHPFMRAVVIVE